MNAPVLRMRSPRALWTPAPFRLLRRFRRGERIFELGSTVSELVESLSSLAELSALQEGSSQWSHLASFR